MASEYKIQVNGVEDLKSALKEVSSARFDAACKIAAEEIYNRGMDGGTPVSTEETRPGGPHGELRQSLMIETGENKAVVGYTKDYAPHVEYGHRTRGGGYVTGQHYLQRNVDQEQEAFKQILKDQLDEVLK